MNRALPYESAVNPPTAPAHVGAVSKEQLASTQNHSLSTFSLTCNSDSMIGAFIPPGARVTVNTYRKPVNGDIVVAALQGKFIIRFLKSNDHKTVLVAANRNYPEITVTPEMQLEFWVVTHIVTDTDHLRRYMR